MKYGFGFLAGMASSGGTTQTTELQNLPPKERLGVLLALLGILVVAAIVLAVIEYFFDRGRML